MKPVPITWVPLWPARPATAVAAHANAAAALLKRLLRISMVDGERFARLNGVIAGETVVVLGASDDLPWVDDATWLGADPDAPGLLVPTTLTSEPALGLVARALRRRVKGPAAVLTKRRQLVHLHGARPLSAERLRGALDTLGGR